METDLGDAAGTTGDTLDVGELTGMADMAGDVPLAVVFKKLCPSSTVVLLTAGEGLTGSGRDCILLFLASKIALAFPGGNLLSVSSRSRAVIAPTGTCDVTICADVTGTCVAANVGDVGVTDTCVETTDGDVVALETSGEIADVFVAETCGEIVDVAAGTCDTTFACCFATGVGVTVVCAVTGS